MILGHLPFSHAGKKEFMPKGLKHEHISEYIVKNDQTIKKVLDNNKVKPNVVASLFIGKPVHKYNVIKAILSGVFDADRADYLLRDSYNCGVSYGNYDYIRYISSFKLEETKGKILKLSVESGNIQTLEAFLLARYNYNMQIPFHRTRTGIDLVLQKYIKHLKDTNRLPILFKQDKQNEQDTNQSLKKLNLKRFIFFDEFELFQRIKTDYKKHNRLSKILLREEHLFPVIETIGTDTDITNFSDFLVKLEENGFKEDKDYIIYKNTGIKIHNLVSGSEEKEKEDIIRVKNKQGVDLGNILECSPILQSLARCTIHLFRVYVFSDKKEMALKLLKEHYKHIDKRQEKAKKLRG
jgi:HD superfamily phosphohydrolase